LNDARNENEPEADFNARVAKQEEMFTAIRSLRGFHVRLGSVSGKRKKLRQKKVDVQLVVDALEHAFRGNMSRVCLVAGDLDFAPLVECLVRLGTYVEVIYEPTSAAVDLYQAADSSQEITFSTVYRWSTKGFKEQHPIPSGEMSGRSTYPRPGYTWARNGMSEGKAIKLYKSSSDYMITADDFDTNHFTLYLRFPDPTFLEKYFGLVYGPIEWS
jgi:hypothetical protein